MAEAAPRAIMDWASTIPAIIAIVIGDAIVEEPVDDAACVGADKFVALDSNDAVSSDEGQPKEVVAEFLANHDVLEPEFAEPDQRRRRRSQGRGGGFGLASFVATTFGELFEEAPEEGASGVWRNCQKRSGIRITGVDIEHSAVERVTIPYQIVEHLGVNTVIDAQSAESHVSRDR